MRLSRLVVAILTAAGCLVGPSAAAAAPPSAPAASSAPAPSSITRQPVQVADSDEPIIGQFNMAGGSDAHGRKGLEVADALAADINSRMPRLAFLTINEGCLDWLDRVEALLPDTYRMHFDAVRGGDGAVATCKHDSPFGNAIIYKQSVLPDPQPVAHELPAVEGLEKREMLCLRSFAKVLVVCTAHLVHSGENVEQRKREAAEVKRVLAAHYAGSTVFLAGDLNDVPGSAVLSNFYHRNYRSAGSDAAHGTFKEAFSPCRNEIKQTTETDDDPVTYCRGGDTTHKRLGTVFSDKLDYVFVPPSVTVHSVQRIWSSHSDHAQLWATVSIPTGFGPVLDSIMVVGDSISQGLEGDYTWRYRLAEHLKAAGRDVIFVGPYRGTTRLPSTLPANFPDESAPPYFNGVYRNGLTFDSDHFAQWGRQAHQTKNDIQARVSQYQPKYLLVELGFNDLGWGVSNPDGLIADMRSLIAKARAGRPDVRILVATVPQRTPLDAQPDLGSKISAYNAKLGPALQALNTATSPVRLVDIAAGYDAYTDAYDGLHPNPQGEHKIAKGFANVLWNQFQLGAAYTIPSESIPQMVPYSPTSMRATATANGIELQWQHSFGASGYWLYQRDATAGEGFQRLPLPIPADSWKVNWVVPGHRYEFRVVAIRGNTTAPTESPIASVTVANLQTAAGPPNVNTTAGPGYIDVSWDAATGPYSDTVRAYTVYYLDNSQPGSVVSSISTTGRSIRLTGLVSGHSYTVAVCSVNVAGEGVPSAGPTRVVG